MDEYSFRKRKERIINYMKEHRNIRYKKDLSHFKILNQFEPGEEKVYYGDCMRCKQSFRLSKEAPKIKKFCPLCKNELKIIQVELPKKRKNEEIDFEIDRDVFKQNVYYQKLKFRNIK